ncbi:MAG: threonine synthase [Spirochaetales bacterium]|nr:threonine synthase [Spirochaetales bacterium]
MNYVSTRDNWEPSEAKAVIRMGMVPDGGLFVPADYPEIQLNELKNITQYTECAITIMKKFLTDYDDHELKAIISQSYSSNFASPHIAPLYTYDNSIGILELWHGPTAAFKDMALQCMPRLLIHSLRSLEKAVKVMILVATSGDTGKAALEGFKNVDGTRIITFYPSEGVSLIQKQQMITQEGDNTKAVGVRGNFDDCQTAVKKAFQDKELREKARQKGFIFSSANSINWGRLVPQIVYYFWAYIQSVKKGMIRWGDAINVCVPTGNFGNILAAYYAYKMGLPVRQFICASNMNNVLTDFLQTGTYSTKREFHTTVSPSMDIVISSNLERLIFDLVLRDGKIVRKYYEELKQTNSFALDSGPLKEMQNLFYGAYAGEEDTFAIIKEVFHSSGYVLDTHTAVGFHVLKKYREKTKDTTPVILTATANPYKFPVAVYYAITGKKGLSDYEALQQLHKKTSMPIHQSLMGIENRKITNRDIIDPEEIETYIEHNL